MPAIPPKLVQTARSSHAFQTKLTSATNSQGSSDYHFLSLQKSSSYFSKVEEVFKSQITPLYGNQDEAIKQIKERRDRRCEILFYNDNPVAFVVYKKELQQEYKKEGLEDSFEVKNFSIMDPSDRNREIYGSILIKRVIKLAQRNFAKNLHITVSEKDEKMKQFLKTTNFSLRKTWEHSSVKGVKEYLFAMKVSEKSSSSTDSERISKIKEKEAGQKRKRSSSEEKHGQFNMDESYQKTETPPVKRRETESDYHRMQEQKNYDYRSYHTSYPESGPDYSRRREDLSPHSRRNQYHQITLKKQYIHQIKYSGKTIEGRINSGMILRFKKGDQIRFFYQHNPSDDVKCDITDIRKYPSFRAMLEKEGFQKCLTDVRSLEQAVRVYDQIPGYAERAARSGVVAIELNVHK